MFSEEGQKEERIIFFKMKLRGLGRNPASVSKAKAVILTKFTSSLTLLACNCNKEDFFLSSKTTKRISLRGQKEASLEELIPEYD